VLPIPHHGQQTHRRQFPLSRPSPHCSRCADPCPLPWRPPRRPCLVPLAKAPPIVEGRADGERQFERPQTSKIQYSTFCPLSSPSPATPPAPTPAPAALSYWLPCALPPRRAPCETGVAQPPQSLVVLCPWLACLCCCTSTTGPFRLDDARIRVTLSAPAPTPAPTAPSSRYPSSPVAPPEPSPPRGRIRCPSAPWSRPEAIQSLLWTRMMSYTRARDVER